MVTGKVFGLLLVALAGLLFYLSIYLFGMHFMASVGLVMTAVWLAVITHLCWGKVDEDDAV
jgi:hypothetical protein